MAESSNANAMVSGLKVSDILLPHPSLPNSMCLGPRSSESPAHLISCEANRIPFVNQDLDLTSWADCLRAWPNPPEGWVAWYNRVSKTHYATWETIGIADALSLSLSPLEKNENILKTIGYFWSDALNCFMFGHGPMTPTLLDVAMITGLDIASPSPSAFKLPKVPFTLSSKTECTSWGAYLKRYMKTKGPGCDLSSLLTFDPESIEPATSKVGEEPSPGTVHGPLQRLKTLLSSSVETLVENPEAVTGILEEIQSHLPVTLQLPMRADIAEKCRRLNEKKAAGRQDDTSANSAELETLQKELENLEERVRLTKRLIQEKETLIARSREEAQGLTADLKTDLAEIRALSKLVTGKDEDDEAEIAEVDRIRADALHALDEFLQKNLYV
ncbi:hypothetical protein QYE76_048419 [Lolium multiflorum]|uniref:Aminotransferase-like plant mobile domain-containing protein n=1 Tax=Lolium multiflorum TaxID=4521 RepID=A0AAD8SLV1_LOLMU|nr:hypothetical protein QYE76_048419 [Lolium multiflorum]